MSCGGEIGRETIRIAVRLLAIVAACATAHAAEEWAFGEPAFWMRAESGARMERGSGGLASVHVAKRTEWSLRGHPEIPVGEGDVFEFSVATRRIGPAPDEYRGGFTIGAVLTGSNGVVAAWNFAKRRLEPGDAGRICFEIPPGIVKMQARLSGSDPLAFTLMRATLVRTVRGGAAPLPAGTERVTSGPLTIAVDRRNAAISVEDSRTGRVWAPQHGGVPALVVERVQREGDAVRLSCRMLETAQRCEVKILPGPAAEFTVEVSGRGEMASPLAYPPPFSTAAGDRMIVPMNEGMGFPVNESHPGLWGSYRFYNGADLPMAFFGIDDDATGVGWCAIVETPDDATLSFPKSAKDGFYSFAPKWEPQFGGFGYARRIRYVFRENGGYVAMAKRYRRHVKESGRFKTFAEKHVTRPAVDRLLGAVNVWCWEDPVKMVAEMRSHGIQRILWSGGGSVEAVNSLAAMPDILVGRYDIYQDIFRPEQMAKLGKPGKVGNNGDAWPADVAWTGPNPSDWRRAWSVKAKDGSWTYCAAMCDSRVAPRLRRNMSRDLAEKHFNTRFLDVVAAGTWMECMNPAHPITRTASQKCRHDILSVVSGEFGLVAGSETGHDAFVDVCDYFEGMLSIDRFRVPDAGRNIRKIWDEVPANVGKYQVGPAYRLPLWELVFHECVCAQWYWGDYSNKLPSIWKRRDLFNVLYGTMPMFMFDKSIWARERERFAASYARTSPVARATGYSEMVAHRILSQDRMVQSSEFADGTVVTVNFGKAPFTLADGTSIPAEDSIVRHVPKTGALENVSYWNGNEFPGATGGVEYAKGSLALRYDFSGGGRYVAARFDLARQPMARSLSFETLFEKGVALGIHVRDASGQNLLRRLEGTPDGDWCAVRISLEENWDGSWGGAKDRRLHLPIQRLEFAAERCGSVPGKGVLRVRNITLSDEAFHEDDGIYPLPCRNVAPDELRRRTDTALAKLRQLVPQMEARGIGAKSRATLTVADRFGEWIETDLAHGLTNRAMRAARERTALAERGVERAQRILDGSETDFAVPRYRTGPVSAEHSQMIGTREHPDGRKDRGTVFLTGFGHFAMAQRDLELFPSLGCNILQMEIGPSHVFPSEGAVNTHALDRFDSVAARAAKANVAVNLLLSPHYFPRWALEKWPHLAGCGGGFFKYCTYADEAKNLIKRYLQIVIPHIRGNPALHSVCLSNEPETHVYGGCPVLRREWPIWLRRRHGDIAALNREMATAYRSFEEVPMPAGSTGNARSRILAEFVRFNTEQFAKWHEWMADCIHGMAPEMQIHSKISVGGVFNDSDPILYSVDPEAFGAFSSFNGNDSSDYCAIFARVSRWSHGWWNMEAAYDWQRASNDKPIFNSENHIHRASRAEFVPGAHTRTVLWQNAIHGQAATTLWRWDRDFDDGKGQPIGLILERPECLEAWAHAALDISRLANVIASIQNLPPSILVCWQRPAVLEGRASTEDFFACYRSAAFLGQQVGIVTEDALADFGRTGVTRRPLDGARVLLFPSARDVPDSVSAGLKRFAASGGVVVYADCTNERALAHRLAEESSRWPIPDHPFARDVAAGTPVYGVETRGVRCDGRAYIYMCNHLKVAQTVRLESDGVDLISGKPVAQVTSVPPLTPMLVELNGKGEKQ